MNRPEEDKVAVDAIVAPSNEATNLTVEARGIVVEASRKKSLEDTEEDAGDDVSQDPPHEL